VVTPERPPAAPAAPVADLNEMIGHYLSVHVTYVHADGHDEHVELVGMVTAVTPVVRISRSDSAQPYTLPPDRKSYRPIPRSPFAPDGWGETALSPRYETRWRVRAPAGSGHGPVAGPFEPKQPQPPTAPVPGRSGGD
jgi:hypothetical protein